MTDDDPDEPGLDDETVIMGGEDDGTDLNDETVIRDQDGDDDQPGGQPGQGDQPSTGGQGGPSVPNASPDSQPTGGQPGGQPGGQDQPSTGGPSVPSGSSSGQGQPSTGGQGQPSTGGQGQPSTGGGGQPGSGTGEVESSETATRSTGGSGSSGLDPETGGALAYLFAPLGGIAMYVMGGDEFVRFHAKQGIAFGILLTVVWVGIAILWPVGGLIAGIIGLGRIFGLLMMLVSLVAFLAGFGLWAFLTYKGYQGERYKLPVIGSFVA